MPLPILRETALGLCSRGNLRTLSCTALASHASVAFLIRSNQKDFRKRRRGTLCNVIEDVLCVLLWAIVKYEFDEFDR